MYSNLKKYKRVLILGASSDIGMSVIKKFLKEDWHVFAHANKSTRRFKKFSIFGKKLKLLKCDLNKQNQVKKLIKFTSKTKIISYINLVGYLDNISYKKTNLESSEEIFSLSIKKLMDSKISLFAPGRSVMICDFLPTEDAVEKLFPSILIPETSLVDLLIGIFILLEFEVKEK